MRVKFEKDGVTFEFECEPMPEHRFRALCLLGALGLYGGMMVGVAALCGIPGIGTLAVATLLIVGIASM